MIAHVHLGGAHDVVRAVSCNLLQSPAVLGHPEPQVTSANFLNMTKNIAELKSVKLVVRLTHWLSKEWHMNHL